MYIFVPIVSCRFCFYLVEYISVAGEEKLLFELKEFQTIFSSWTVLDCIRMGAENKEALIPSARSSR